MHTDTARRCYFYTLCLSIVCLLTFLYTTRIVDISTMQRLNSICSSKLKIKAWLEEIINKKGINNFVFKEVERKDRSFDQYSKLGSWKKLNDAYGYKNFKADGEVNGEESTILQEEGLSNGNDRIQIASLDEESKKAVLNISEESLDRFSEKLTDDEKSNGYTKRSAIGDDALIVDKRDQEDKSNLALPVNGIDHAMTTAKLQFTPLRYRKYGDDWLMTKDELGFLRAWCIQRDYRLNWQRILAPCKYSTAWNRSKPYWTPNNITNAVASFVFDVDLRQSGQYSRFYIQAVSQDGTKKKTGGDTWRIHIQGASNVPVTVMDHENGIYEVLFLILEPGKYSADIILDYTMCDGMKDPPIDWFKKGNSQGKYQHPDALPGYEHPYLLETLPGGFDFNVEQADVSIFEEMNGNGLLEKYCPNPSCFIWDGFGTWVAKVWKPYVSETKEKEPMDRRDGTLWIYGDSVGDLFYKSISKRALCHEIFANCNHTYNWVYVLKNMDIARAKTEWDDKDFSIDRIITELDNVLSDPQMNDRSVIIINMGLHYVQGINFTSFRKLIDRTIDLLASHKNSPHGFHGKTIWKTTTALFKERYGDPQSGARHSKGLRFLTVPRVQLFNAFATTSMCNHGIDVLDVHPISDSFPGGTGGVSKPWDAVHFSADAFKPVEDLLEEYLG